MDIKLNRLITTQALTPEVAACMRHRFIPINLPTEVVVAEPRYVVPRQARAFRTNFFVVDGNVVLYHELCELRGADFKGTTYERNVYLIEVWEDFGDDGHVSWCLIGWKFIESNDLDHASDRFTIVRATNEDYDVYITALRAE